jgi:hypothetical protein
MSEQEKWERLREIVRQECERIEERILAVLAKNKIKVDFINGKWMGVTEAQKEAWLAAYPSCDLDTELKKAAAWIVSNPNLAPKSQFGRFLNMWLSKQQNQNSLRSIPTNHSVRSSTSPHRFCDYCGKNWVGSTNGYYYCTEHHKNAQDREKPPKMPGVAPKAVAGS